MNFGWLGALWVRGCFVKKNVFYEVRTIARCCHPLAGCFPPLFLLPKKEHGNHTATDDSGAPLS